MVLSPYSVLNLKLERLCLAKKTLKDCGFSTRPKANPKEFPSTRSALATIFHTLHSMAGSRRHRRRLYLFINNMKGIQNSAIYNTFIETCKQAGVSFRDYFCKLLRELKKGRTDYENLLPMTICK